MRTTRLIAILALGILLTSAADSALADDFYCCAYCQGGNRTPTPCVIGSCYWYAEQRCFYEFRQGQTVCNTMIDPLTCPRTTFTADPWGALEASSETTRPSASSSQPK